MKRGVHSCGPWMVRTVHGKTPLRQTLLLLCFGGGDAYPLYSRDTFTGYLSNTDMHAPRVSASATTNDLAYRALDRLQRSRRRLGSQRHDLIVALRVINSIEQEVVEAEWEGWLYGETAKCKQVEMLLRDDLSPIVGNDSRYRTRQQGALGRGSVDLTEVRSWHENYCGSCVDEQDSLHEKQARSSG